MRRLAAPLLGGLFTSFLMELLIYPIIFYVVKGIGLRQGSGQMEAQRAFAIAAAAGNGEGANV
jgi:Cu(I)/Ag(I) efflux system membrane protein CusA/SilA